MLKYFTWCGWQPKLKETFSTSLKTIPVYRHLSCLQSNYILLVTNVQGYERAATIVLRSRGGGGNKQGLTQKNRGGESDQPNLVLFGRPEQTLH